MWPASAMQADACLSARPPAPPAMLSPQPYVADGSLSPDWRRNCQIISVSPALSQEIRGYKIALGNIWGNSSQH
jgi:hypothetical protein